jgi:shikimate dehydrogenase
MVKNFAIIGDPVKHSLSPFIHQMLYQIYDIEASYHKLQIAKGQLADKFLALVQKYELDGLNVTMPHKTDIIDFLDDISPAAALAKSVNTIVRDAKGLHGYSTDAAGFMQALRAQNAPLPAAGAVFLGAGGAAGALALHWAVTEKAPLTIIARTQAKAWAIKEVIAQNNGHQPLILPWTKDNIHQAAGQALLLVNTTPLGMVGNKEDFTDLSFLRQLPSSALVFDLIYAPRQTTLLKEAQKLGYATANGLDMLIYQAIESFQLMTGIQASLADKNSIEKALAEQGLI